MQEIKSWDYGLLFLKPHECIGTDTRFAKDAVVLIIAKVESYSLYLQIIGRSSRSRNVCDGILYCPTLEKASVILQRMKSHSCNMLLELEHLMHLLEKKAKDVNLVKAIKKRLGEGQMIQTVKDVEQSMDGKVFEKLMKNVNV